MAGPCACRSPCRNPASAGKNDLAGAVPTEGSGTPTTTPVVSRTPTSAPAAALAPLLTSAAADSAARYSTKDFQGILKTILEARAPAPQSESFCDRPLKTRALDLSRGKTHMEYYNFRRQCKDHFATANATRLNRLPFAATFLKDWVLFRWQQHQRKLADKPNVLIS